MTKNKKATSGLCSIQSCYNRVLPYYIALSPSDYFLELTLKESEH